jgi:hypothetical protein
MRLTSRLSFLAGTGALAFAAIGIPASAATGYVWPLVVSQPITINKVVGNGNLSVTCTLKLQNGSTIGTGSIQAFYSPSTLAGGSANVGVFVDPTPNAFVKLSNGWVTTLILLGGEKMHCDVSVETTLYSGSSNYTLPSIIIAAGQKFRTSAPSSVTMPNIRITIP